MNVYYTGIQISDKGSINTLLYPDNQTIIENMQVYLCLEYNMLKQF